jgi:hypothetical protein
LSKPCGFCAGHAFVTEGVCGPLVRCPSCDGSGAEPPDTPVPEPCPACGGALWHFDGIAYCPGCLRAGQRRPLRLPVAQALEALRVLRFDP